MCFYWRMRLHNTCRFVWFCWLNERLVRIVCSVSIKSRDEFIFNEVVRFSSLKAFVTIVSYLVVDSLVENIEVISDVVLNRAVIGFIEMNNYEQCQWNSLVILPTDSISLFYFYFINTSGVLFIYVLCKYRYSKTSLR